MNAELNLQAPLGQGERPMEDHDRQPPPPSTAAVPISVYRELAAELQTTQAELYQLRSENQRLVEQNRSLRQEADRVVELTQTLQKAAQRLAFSPPGSSVAPYSATSLDRANAPAAPGDPYGSYGPPANSGYNAGGYASGPEAGAMPGEAVQAGENPKSSSRPTAFDRPEPRPDLDREGMDSGGWWLVLTVILIVMTAFGTGFLIVRPFLPNSNGTDETPPLSNPPTLAP